MNIIQLLCFDNNFTDYSVHANICICIQNLEAIFLYLLLNIMFAKNLLLAVRVYDMNIPTLSFEFIFHYVLLQLPCII